MPRAGLDVDGTQSANPQGSTKGMLKIDPQSRTLVSLGERTLRPTSLADATMKDIDCKEAVGRRQLR